MKSLKGGAKNKGLYKKGLASIKKYSFVSTLFMHKTKRRLIASASSLIILMALTLVLWLPNKNYEYESLGISIYITLAYLAAIILGIICIILRVARPSKNSFDFGYNFVGTFNLYISAVGIIYIYLDNVDRSVEYIGYFLISLFLGILILADLYFNNK